MCVSLYTEIAIVTEMRKEVPDPVWSRRQTAGRFVRFIYASLILGLGLFLGWQILKPFIYTQSAGSVVAPYHVVSTPFTARITQLLVKPGESVNKDQVVAIVRSPEIDALQANLLSSIAEQVNKEADLRIRLLVATSSHASARNQVAAFTDCSEMLSKHPESVSSVFRAQMLRECAQASADLARIEAEISETSKQIDAVVRARKKIEEVKEFVDKAFNDGRQTSPIQGIVATHVANPGQSVTAGTSIVEVYNPAELYVQWILSADRLTQPAVGAPVYVLEGNRVMRANIAQTYSISERSTDGLTVFSRRRTGQLVRIELLGNQSYPPYMTDVEVRYNYWRFMDRAVDWYVDMMTWLGLWREH